MRYTFYQVFSAANLKLRERRAKNRVFFAFSYHFYCKYWYGRHSKTGRSILMRFETQFRDGKMYIAFEYHHSRTRTETGARVWNIDISTPTTPYPGDRPQNGSRTSHGHALLIDSRGGSHAPVYQTTAPRTQYSAQGRGLNAKSKFCKNTLISSKHHT